MTDAPASAGPAVPAPPVFIENDYKQARAEALRRGVPLVVFGWSPWCTDCLGMKAFVFSDMGLSCAGSRFVWVALDVDNENNAEFWGRFPVETTPTLWIIEPDRQRPVAMHVGPLKLDDLLQLLDDGEARGTPRATPVASGSASGSAAPRVFQCPGAAGAASASASASASAPAASSSGSASASAPPPPPPPPPRDLEGEASSRLIEASIAELEGSPKAAERAYRKALQAPRRWGRRAEAVDGLQRLLSRRDLGGCVALAEEELPELPVSTHSASVARRALRCARQQEERGRSAAERAAATLEAMARGSSSSALLPSHRSNLFEDLVQYHKAAGDSEQSRRLALDWAGFLELEATLARSGEQRVVFDEHRLRVADELGTVVTALPALEQTVNERPDDGPARVRLARGLMSLKRRKEALVHLEKALPSAQGQGRLRILLHVATLQIELGKIDEARRTLTGAIAEAEKRPPSVDHEHVLKGLRKKMSELSQGR